MLGKYGLYTDIGGLKTIKNIGEYYRRILYYCDGENDLIDIYEKLKDYININELIKLINILLENNLIYFNK